MSPLTRGAWIEICSANLYAAALLASPLTRGAWIEIKYLPSHSNAFMSPLTRGAWIEMEKQKNLKKNHLCRPSPEGRGLKFGKANSRSIVKRRPSPEGRGLKWVCKETGKDPAGRPSPEGRGLKFARG